MPDKPPETIPWRVAALEEALKEQKTLHEKEVSHLETEISKLRERFDARERNMFIAGITFLGGIIFSLIGVIWANLGAIFPGRG